MDDDEIEHTEPEEESFEESLDEELSEETEELLEEAEESLEEEIVEEETTEAPSHPLEDVPLKFTVQMGHKAIPLADLLKLEPGNILSLDKPFDGHVDIVVQGKVVGKGELIEVGNVMGVRILELG